MLSCVCIALWLAAAPAALAREADPGPREGEITREEAWEMAREQFVQDSVFLEENPEDFQLTLTKVEEEPGSWPGHYVAAFASPGAPDMAYYLLLSAQPGLFPHCGGGQLESSPERLKEELAENYRVWTATEAWEKDRGPYCFWSPEDKAAFAAEFGSAPGRWSMEVPLAVPQAGDVSLSEACRRADAFLEKEFALTPGQVAAMPKDVAFYTEHYTNNLGHVRCWVVLYRGELPGEQGLYPLLYQVTVPSPLGEVGGIHNFEVDTLMALGLSAQVAAKLTELPTLYYIPYGGRFYHIMKDCASVPEKYLPMEGFDTGRLDGDPFTDLVPCPFCIQ